MTGFPEVYSKMAYLQWHNTVVEPSEDLEAKLDAMVAQLKEDSRERLKKLANILSQLNSFQLLKKKTSSEDISDAETDIQLIDSLQSPVYDGLFKSTESIIDKLWRKNKSLEPGKYVNSENIKSEIGDLVRTSIVTSTFSYAESFSSAMIYWKEIAEQARIDPADFQDIKKISPKEEAKMANGYFAHHVDVLYDDGLRVEIQIYSKMSEIWRHLSHKLYEKVRLGEDVEWGHGTAASRLVSLGHLLHLAECEVEFLKTSMQR